MLLGSGVGVTRLHGLLLVVTVRWLVNDGGRLVLGVSVVLGGVVLSVWLGGVVVDLGVLGLHVVAVLGSGVRVLSGGLVVLLSGGGLLGSGSVTGLHGLVLLVRVGWLVGDGGGLVLGVSVV